LEFAIEALLTIPIQFFLFHTDGFKLCVLCLKGIELLLKLVFICYATLSILLGTLYYAFCLLPGDLCFFDLEAREKTGKDTTTIPWKQK